MKRIFIIRGLPGAGKTTLAGILSPEHSVAADDFMVDENGGYAHNVSRIKECHERCIARVKEMAENGVVDIAVHNTFSKNWEMAPYFEIAKAFGYEAFVIECQNNFGSIHGVPQATVDRMKERWE